MIVLSTNFYIREGGTQWGCRAYRVATPIIPYHIGRGYVGRLDRHCQCRTPDGPVAVGGEVARELVDRTQ
jgi:hypothetical protein